MREGRVQLLWTRPWAGLSCAGDPVAREEGMDLGIAGKRALVCAASKGLGKGCAVALAEEGV